MWKRRREGARSCKGKAGAGAAGAEQEAGRGPCVPPAAAGRRQTWIAGPFAAASASGLCSGKARAQPGLSHSPERAQIALHPLLVLGSRFGSSCLCLPLQGRRLPPGLGNGRVSIRDSRNRLWAAAERGHPLGNAARPLVAPRNFPSLRVRSRESPRPTPPQLARSSPARREDLEPPRLARSRGPCTFPQRLQGDLPGAPERRAVPLSPRRSGTASFFWTSPLPGVGVVLSSGQPLSSFRCRLPGWASYWRNPLGPSSLRTGLSTETARVLLGFPNPPECNSVLDGVRLELREGQRCEELRWWHLPSDFLEKAPLSRWGFRPGSL